jgi:hypothetical protein
VRQPPGTDLAVDPVGPHAEVSSNLVRFQQPRSRLTADALCRPTSISY